MFKLVIEDDEGNKTVVPIIRDEITIGRREGNTIRLTERNVSREHAKLIRRDGEVFIEELSARYGTKKNGNKIDGETEFDVGDVFSIGDYRLTLQSDVVTEAKPPPTPKGSESKSEPPGPPPEAKSRTRPKNEGTEIIATDPARLVIVSSNFAGQEFPLARKEMVIGRGEECDIIIDHRSVSQKHAKVVRENSGEYKIVDLKSKNGVKVGGEEYRAVHLKRGDILELGHVKFRFVESGENYVFTPQIEDDVVAEASSKKGAIVGALVLIALVSGAIAFVAMRPDTGEAIPTTDPAQTNAVAVATTGEEEANDLDEKIDRAEADYLAGKVEKAAGMLELLRSDDPTAEQVERIDSLLSKTKREIGFVRYFENGRDHFEAERWLPALSQFQQIPDDDELNVYRLVKEGGYVDKAVVNATAEQLEIAKNGEDERTRDAAGERLAELQAMFPSHVAPPEAIAELEASGGKRPEPKPIVRRPKPPKRDPVQKPDPKPEPEPTTVEVTPPPSGPDADQLLTEAKQAFFQSKFNTAKSKAKDATKLGCRADCYRVIGMSHYKLGETEQACSWLAKAAGELPADLDCP